VAIVLAPRPLAENDDRLSFDCGRASMNLWFQRHAWSNHAAGISRITILPDAKDGHVVGYVTLSAAQIERAFLPKSQQRNRPDPVPVTLLGQLAVETASQGQGHAVSLLRYALRTALAASDIVGSLGVITHPIDDGVRAFYAKWGFADLTFDPRRAMMVRMSDLVLAFKDQ
jgi:GNAT superfamily N-acetyltransferase